MLIVSFVVFTNECEIFFFQIFYILYEIVKIGFWSIPIPMGVFYCEANCHFLQCVSLFVRNLNLGSWMGWHCGVRNFVWGSILKQNVVWWYGMIMFSIFAFFYLWFGNFHWVIPYVVVRKMATSTNYVC